MKYSLTALAFVAAALPASPAHAACTVTVASFSYSPATKTVAPGTSVTWCWTGDNHSVTADNGSFDSHATCPPTCGNTGHEFPHTFSQAGTFDYHCKIHSGMTARIVAAQPSPTRTASPTPKPTTRSPAPARTTTAPAPAPTTTPPTRFPTPTPTPTTAAPTTTPPLPPTTTPPATTSAPATPGTTPAAVEIDPAPAKPKTGLAIGLGLLVAAASIGGAAWLLLRGRAG